MIRSREYRYLSPVFQHIGDGRITRILRAALTNNPNLELTALAAAEGTDMDLQTELRQLLTLPEDADEAAILASARERLSATAAVDPTQYVPIGELVKATAELQRVNRGVTLQAATKSRAVAGEENPWSTWPTAGRKAVGAITPNCWRTPNDSSFAAS